jgi:hypothetical protein
MLTTNSDTVESNSSVRKRRFHFSISGCPRKNIELQTSPNNTTPLECRVLTWDSPDNRESWSDHGIDAIYIGPALDHFRAFNVWSSTNSASRVTNIVWWFMKPKKPSQDLLQLDLDIAYPPTRDRPNPSDNGSDILGRHFLEPELGVCCITGLEPILHKVISTTAERNQQRLKGSP